MNDKPKCPFCGGHGKSVVYGPDYHLERPCGFCGGTGKDDTGKLARIHADIQQQEKREEKEERVEE